MSTTVRQEEDDDVSYEALSRLQYVDMCIDEALRMYPPASR